jgi:hypothetical protein
MALARHIKMLNNSLHIEFWKTCKDQKSHCFQAFNDFNKAESHTRGDVLSDIMESLRDPHITLKYSLTRGRSLSEVIKLV